MSRPVTIKFAGNSREIYLNGEFVISTTNRAQVVRCLSATNAQVIFDIVQNDGPCQASNELVEEIDGYLIYERAWQQFVVIGRSGKELARTHSLAAASNWIREWRANNFSDPFYGMIGDATT